MIGPGSDNKVFIQLETPGIAHPNIYDDNGEDSDNDDDDKVIIILGIGRVGNN